MKNSNSKLILSIILLSIVVLGCKGPSSKQINVIEDLTRKHIAVSEEICELYNSNFLSMRETLNQGKITENGFEFYNYLSEAERGFYPEDIVSLGLAYEEVIFEIGNLYLEDNDLSIEEISKKIIDKYSYVDYISEQAVQISEKILNRSSELVVVLSEFEPIESSGKTKMWIFTELNSGYEYKAIKNDENISVILTDRGKDKYKEDIVESAKPLNDLYTEYLQMVEVKKQEKKEEDEKIRKFFFGF